jgi:MFS family permease
MIALFTLLTVTPSGLGLVLGGRLADDHGRRKVAAFCVPVGAALLAVSFATTSFLMWGSAMLGGVIAATAYPAMAVYRGELFPTRSRTTASFLVTVSALLGGSIGLVVGGSLVDSGWSYGSVMILFASVGIVVAGLVWFFYPETAHRELEELNPQDA